MTNQDVERDPLVKRFFALSILIVIGGFAASLTVDAIRGPENLGAAFIYVICIGGILLPISGAIEWYLPIGKQRGYGRVRSLIGVATLAIALGYWMYAVVYDLVSPASSFSLIGTGAILSSLGFFMYFYGDVTRRNKEIR